jgi:hypothetical protein
MKLISVLCLISSASFEKCKVYNKNGRIGIYTPAERAAIIARFQSKRSRRVWNKKIRYNCRKNLADRRLRIKGRFVKRSIVEQQEQYESTDAKVEKTVTISDKVSISSIPRDETDEVDHVARETNNGDEDVDMPDINDPDAGFCPTDDQPYRRLRRHTIT